jgi:L-asparaginase
MAETVVFLGMGGTIAGTSAVAGDNVGYTAAQVGVAQLLESVPSLQAALGPCQARSEQVCQIDSKNLVHADWQALLERVDHHLSRSEVVGVVVTHGTDTLEETAYFLARTLAPQWLQRKPVVLTCAMRPASSLNPDGPGNMRDATTLALCPGAHGVLVVCAGKAHGATQVQKVHPYRVDAFDSGEAGPLAVVEEGRVRQLAQWPASNAPWCSVDMVSLPVWPRVELLISHAGATGAVVRALLNAVDSENPLRGIVVAGTGNGTIHKDMEVALTEAELRGVRVVRTSRCAFGQVVGDGPAARSGAFASSGLSAVKARIALMLDLANQL